MCFGLRILVRTILREEETLPFTKYQRVLLIGRTVFNNGPHSLWKHMRLHIWIRERQILIVCLPNN